MKLVHSDSSIKRKFVVANTIILSIPIAIAMMVIVSVIIVFTGGNLIRDFRINTYIDIADVAELGETSAKRYAGKMDEGSVDDANAILRRYATKYNAYIIVTENGTITDEFGTPIDTEDMNELFQLASSVGTDATLTRGRTAVFVRNLPGENKQLYYFAILGNGSSVLSDLQYFAGFTAFNIVLALIAAGLIIIINKAMMKHVFNRMEKGLNLLLDAVHEIQSGNLDHRIVYNNKDEFAEICTEFNQMAQNLKESRAIISKQQQSRKDMFISISHDIRSPLTSIIAYVEGLRDGIALTPQKQRRYLEIIYHKAQDIDRMVTQILTYSKSELNELPFNNEQIQLDRFISGYVYGIRESSEANGLTVTILDITPARIQTDVAMLKRIFGNIIENSSKYKVKDHAHLLISLTREGDHCILTFTDDGPGIQESNLPHIFDVMYRGDAARQDTGNGCGMGLAIVKNLVDVMGGSVTAENAPEGGLRITVTLPVEDEERGETNE